MPLQIVLYVWGSGLILLGVAAYFIWAIWIARYVEYYGLKPAFFLSVWAPLVDYHRAKVIARKLGTAPWFVRLFGRVTWVGLFFLLAGGLWVLITLWMQRS
jgi:hypothetical protein